MPVYSINEDIELLKEANHQNLASNMKFPQHFTVFQKPMRGISNKPLQRCIYVLFLLVVKCLVKSKFSLQQFDLQTIHFQNTETTLSAKGISIKYRCKLLLKCGKKEQPCQHFRRFQPHSNRTTLQTARQADQQLQMRQIQIQHPLSLASISHKIQHKQSVPACLRVQIIHSSIQKFKTQAT